MPGNVRWKFIHVHIEINIMRLCVHMHACFGCVEHRLSTLDLTSPSMQCPSPWPVKVSSAHLANIILMNSKTQNNFNSFWIYRFHKVCFTCGANNNDNNNEIIKLLSAWNKEEVKREKKRKKCTFKAKYTNVI